MTRKASEVENEKFWREQYAGLGRGGGLWLCHADALARSALHLSRIWAPNLSPDDYNSEADTALGRPALMLMGLSLEALAKGLMIVRTPELITEARINRALLTHDTGRLIVDRLKIELDDVERHFIDRCRDHVIWRGKYPLAVGAEQQWYRPNWPNPFTTGHLYNVNSGCSPDDYLRFEPLYLRLREMLVGETLDQKVASTERA